jgi:hypothetical protein
MLQGEEVLVLPLVVMGSLLVAGGACSLLLPETLNQHLPQSLEDGEKFGKEWTWKNLAGCCPSRYKANGTGSKSCPVADLCSSSAKPHFWLADSNGWSFG